MANQPIRVLVVDDALHILRAAEFKLKRCGFQVTCAADGEEAWERLQTQVPDLLITDYQMPRLDGVRLIERIRATPTLAHLPVVMLTAKGFELTPERAFNELGIRALINKPFSPRDLCRQVELAVQPPHDSDTAVELASLLQACSGPCPAACAEATTEILPLAKA